MPDELTRYIRENRERYTPEALRAELEAAGYPAAEVETAFIAAESDDQAPPPDEAPVSSIRFLVTGLAIVVVGLAFAVAIAAAVIFGLAGLGGSGSYMPGPGQSIILFGYAVAMGFALWIVGPRVARGQSRTGSWTGLAAAFGVSVLLFVGLSGACIAGLGRVQ